MGERVALVTGANAGIGFQVASGLAAAGCVTVMLCRDPERGAMAARRVAEATGGRAELLVCDLASQVAIRDAATAFRTRYPRLDILVHNAGMNAFTRTLTADGVETVWAVNVVAPFLLTEMLSGAMHPGARVVTVAGISHRQGRLDFANLQGERHFDGMEASRRAQLARVVWTFELARRRGASGVCANAMHPGAVRSGLQRKLPWRMRVMAVPVSWLFRSPASGAKPIVHLALAPETGVVCGRYFNRFREVKAAPAASDEPLAARLWGELARVSGAGA